MTKLSPTHRLAYSVPEFASQFGYCKQAVYNLISRGEIRAIRIGTTLRIPAAAADRLLAGAK